MTKIIRFQFKVVLVRKESSTICFYSSEAFQKVLVCSNPKSKSGFKLVKFDITKQVFKQYADSESFFKLWQNQQAQGLNLRIEIKFKNKTSVCFNEHECFSF